MIIKKILLSTAVFCLIGVPSAHAGMDVQLNLGVPVYPVYAAPQSVYVSPYPEYYDPRHRHHNDAYWLDQRGHGGHDGHGGAGHAGNEHR